MLKTKFEAQQYLIREAEIKLHNDTQMLLTEMLRSLSEDDLKKLQNTFLDDSEHTPTLERVIIKDNVIIFEIVDDTNYHYTNSLDEISQPIQKSFIDYMLDKRNHFTFNQK